MLNIKYELANLSKSFVRNHYVLKDVSLNINNSDIYAITGANGSGKSTLIKILAGVLLYDSGELRLKMNSEDCSFDDLRQYISLVAPYLNLYEEFTPIEHYKVAAELQGIDFNKEKLENDLELFNIHKSRNIPIKNFSSGMKQRMKFILAMQNDPYILLLDEPTANLDKDGIDIIFKIIDEHKKKNALIVIATNEEREKAVCNKFYDVTHSNSSKF